MKNRKFLLLLSLLVVFALSLAACTGTSTDEVDDAAGTAEAAAEEAVTEAEEEVGAAVDEAATTAAEDAMHAEETAAAMAAEGEDAMHAEETSVAMAAEEAMHAEETAAAAAAPTEEAAVEEEPAADMMSVAAENCDYGGKISSIEAADEMTVVFNLCRPDPAFLAKVAFTPFGIQPSEWIEANGGTGDLLEHPIGTGPYMLDTWSRGDSITYQRFDDYWGEPAAEETAVLRWATEGAARLVELQAGTVDMIANVTPGDYEAVESDSNLQLLPLANPNVMYLAMTNNTFEPFANPQVRQAIALGIDRQRIVDNFYPAGSEVASHFTPCSIPNGCEGEAWHEFDAEAARALLAEAGYPDGFETSIYYRNVFRGYLPEPAQVAVELQTQLKENLGITAEIVEMESGAFIDESTSGRLDGFYMLGWGADYPHITNFLDYHFGAESVQFGDPHAEIYELLQEASSIADTATAAPLYEQANNAIRELVPMVPIAHGASAAAALATTEGAYVPPFGGTDLAALSTGKGTVVFMQSAEPISLYCADETDGESLNACQQVVEPLLNYMRDSGDTQPALATECTSNEDATVFTCKLREGVLFHDGSALDANDVIVSWAAGIDAANPNHVGNTGAFDYFNNLWDGFINAPPAE